VAVTPVAEMTVPIRRILACIQFDSSRDGIASYARTLSERFQAELHLLHVFEATPEPDVAALTPDEASYSVGGEERLLAGIIPKEWEERFVCRRAVAFGVPWIEIVRYSREHGIDMIVLGASDCSELKRWLFGSVPDQVAHHPPCPIVIVPPWPEGET
jgi:universal stress protein A